MFRFETEVDKERRVLLGERLEAANAHRSPAMRALAGTPHEDEVPLQVWVVDETSGELAAGLAGRTWARWLHVDLLWVDTPTAARASAPSSSPRPNARPASAVAARTPAWRPGTSRRRMFYRRHGYAVVGRVPDYPPGVTEYILTKALG